MSYTLDRQFYIPKEAKVIATTDTAIVYGYDIPTGKTGAIAFNGKAQKPSWHYSFKSEAERQAYIDRWFTSLDQHNQYKAERKQARQAEILESNIKPGDYFYTSWGYDQTNIDYLIVSSVTAKTAICRMANPIFVDAEAQQDVLMPGCACGDTFRMQINGKDSLVGSYPYCVGHSSKRLGHFWRTSITTLHRQTNPLFGH